MNLNSSMGLKEHGINVVWPTVIGTWGGNKKVITETPVQFRGGKINALEIGAFTYMGQGNSVYHHVAKTGRFCALGPGVVTGDSEHPTDALTPHPMFAWKFDPSWKETESIHEDRVFIKALQQKMNGLVKKKAMIEIGNDVWIGNGAYISRGVKIGDGAIIAARAVVTKDVPPYTIVGGVPAKPIRQRFSDKIIDKLLELQWWEYGPLILKNVDITDVETTIYEIEERIGKGFKKYTCDKIEFNLEEKRIYKLRNDCRELIKQL